MTIINSFIKSLNKEEWTIAEDKNRVGDRARHKEGETDTLMEDEDKNRAK